MLAPYPLTAEEIRQKKERQRMLTEKIIPKSQILRRARQEHETAEHLGRVFDAMLVRAGFRKDGNEFVRPVFSTDDSRTMLLLGDAEVAKTVHASELHQAFRADKEAHPMCCADAAINLVKDLTAARRELRHQYNGLQVGQDGEDAVVAHLKNIAEAWDDILCDSVLLNKQISGHAADTSEIDVCIITPQGIVLCEVKNQYREGNKKICLSRAGSWEVYDRDTGHQIPVKSNPITQNNTHERDMVKFLRSKGYGFVPTIPVIVIANEDVKIEGESRSDVIYMSALQDFIRDSRLNPPCLTREQMEDIARLLQEESENVPERAFKLKVLSQSADALQELMERSLSEYKQEQYWRQENSQIFFEFVKSVKERVEAERQEKREQEEAVLRKLAAWNEENRKRLEAERQRVEALEEAERQRIQAQQEAERQRLAAQQAAARKLAQEKNKRRTGCLAGIFCVAAAFLIALQIVFGTISIPECVRLLPYKLGEDAVFCNYFEDTAVLTNWPIQKYNGQKCTGQWTDLSLAGPGLVAAGRNVDTVVILEDIYPTSLESVFYQMSNLKRIEGVEKLHLDNVESMAYMFSGCQKLEEIDFLSGWDVSNVTDMSGMFDGCSSLRNLDALSNWDVSNVENMRRMFYICQDLENIDGISDWDVSNVESMREMFEECDGVPALPSWYHE